MISPFTHICDLCEHLLVNRIEISLENGVKYHIEPFCRKKRILYPNTCPDLADISSVLAPKHVYYKVITTESVV